MPYQKPHWRQAEHNRNLAEELITETPILYRDWAVIAGFYAAVHFIESYRDYYNGSHSQDHLERKKWVTKNLSSIDIQYRALYHASLSLRYLEFEGDTFKPCAEWMPEDDAIDLINKDLESIAQEIDNIINGTQSTST